MNSSSLDLMLEPLFFALTLYYREFFAPLEMLLVTYCCSRQRCHHHFCSMMTVTSYHSQVSASFSSLLFLSLRSLTQMPSVLSSILVHFNFSISFLFFLLFFVRLSVYCLNPRKGQFQLQISTIESHISVP